MELSSRLEDAFEAALARYEIESEKALRRRFGTGPTASVVIRDGRRFDASVLAHLMLEASSRPGDGAARSTETSRAMLEGAGAQVKSLSAWSVDDERDWRLAAWQAMQSIDIVSARWLRDRGLFGGAQGIWVDKARTEVLAPAGAAVAVLHTGRHYADDIDGKKVLYHYPRTSRPTIRDANEVEAVKNAGRLGLPLFLITEGTYGARLVALAWVVAADDEAQAFLLEVAETEPQQTDYAPPAEGAPFVVKAGRARRRVERDVLDRDPEFKFRVLRRYEGACAVTGVAVKEVLDAAHVVPVDKGGPDDERNGILLTATLHRALDAHLWALHPKSLALVTRAGGPTLTDLRVRTAALRPDAPLPHEDALEWRYKRFRQKQSEPIDEALDELGLMPA